MPFRIELSEQGSFSHTIRAVELALALDALAQASVHCDFKGAPWRHLLSGKQQVHLRRLTQEPRRNTIDENFAPTDTTSLWLRAAQLLPAYPPQDAWLLTTGGVPHAHPEYAKLWFGHIETIAPGFGPTNPSAATALPIALDTQVFFPRTRADDGILVIGCGEPAADRQLLSWLGQACHAPLTLFDPYTQHTLTPLPAGVTRVELAQPAARAALYGRCRYVISGAAERCVDDHFVCEAVQCGSIALAGYTPGAGEAQVWTAADVKQAWQARSAREAEHPGMYTFMDVREQAAAIDTLIHQPATGAAWTAPRITQYASCAVIDSPSTAQLAWLDCGREAQWDDALTAWLAAAPYQVIYVDISHNALLLSQVFTTFLSAQLRDRTRQMPHIQGVDDTEELAQLVRSHLATQPTHTLDVLHVGCSMPRVLQTRKRLETLLHDAADQAAAPSPSSAHAARPRFLFNAELPAETTRLSAKMIGAPVAADGVFQGVLREAAGRFETNWARSTDFWSSYGRVYYFPFAPATLQDKQELDSPQICAGLRDGVFDLIMTGGPLMTDLLYARRLYATKSVPMVAMLHSLHSIRNQLETLPQLIFATSLASDLFISPTECGKIAYAKLLEQSSEAIASRTGTSFKYKGDIRVVPYGIDTSWYQNKNKGACRELLRLPQERRIFLSLGRFHRYEKFDLLPVLLALHKMVQAGDNPLLVLSGANEDHNYAEEIRRAAHHLNLAEYVDIRENVPSAHKPYLYGACDVFISPSDNIQETYGLTIVEAMAASLPVIASRWDGYREIVQDEVSGFLIPTRWTQVPHDLMGLLTVSEGIAGYGHRDMHESIAVDVDALTARMRLLYRDDTLRARMGQAGLRRAQTHFDIRCQSQMIADTLLERLEMARGETWPALDASNAPYIDDVFARFSHYTPDIISSSVQVRLTSLGQDEDLLRAVLQAAEFGDAHEDRKVLRLVARLKQGPASIASLQDVDIDPIRAMRCLKYGIIQVAP